MIRVERVRRRPAMAVLYSGWDAHLAGFRLRALVWARGPGLRRRQGGLVRTMWLRVRRKLHGIG